MGAFHMEEKKKRFNIENITAFIGAIAVLISFWTSQMNMMTELKNIGERTAKLEVEIVNLKVNELIKMKIKDS